jgi:hypothetical protein
MNRYKQFAKCAFLAVVTGLGLMLAGSPLTARQEGAGVKAKVYVYPHKLTAKDKLSFGPDTDQKKLIPIKGETTLIYVDLAPEARFAHATQCILISSEGARVIQGDWWLILNGKDLFRDGRDVQVNFPVNLSGK